MCILDLSKALTYEFFKKYRSNLRLTFTDTDSLMYEIKTDNFYEDFSKDREMFDFINYSARIL